MHEGWVADNRGLRAQFAAVHRRLDEIEELTPGPSRMAAIAAVRSGYVDSAAAVRMRILDAGDRAWHEAQIMISTNDAVDGHGYSLGATTSDRIEMTGHEFAAALHTSYAQANNEIAFHLYVGERLAHSWVALSQGRLSVEQVKAIYHATEHCSARVAEAVDATIAPLAIERGWNSGQIRKHARKVIIKIDPDGAADRAKKAKAGTNVDFCPENDEMGTVRAYGDAPTARSIFDTINARATQLGRDPLDGRSIGQRRFDALAEFVLGPAEGSETVSNTSLAQQRARRRGEALVRLDLTTALGLDDNPGYLDGYGPITADLARRLATDCDWRRWITAPRTGHTLDLGRSTYRPSAALRRLVEAEHPTCTMIGCERPARFCQTDHKTEYERLGCTDCQNLHPLCQMHHQQKTKKRWTLNQHPDGDTWTSALGFTYARNDAPYDIPLLEPPDPEYFEYLPGPSPSRDLAPPYPDEPLPPEPPLDPYETDELTSVLDNGFGEFAQRAYNLLRAAQLID